MSRKKNTGLSAADRQARPAGSGDGGDGNHDPNNGDESLQSLQDHLPFWRNLEMISEYQRGVFENWNFLWSGPFQTWMQVAPTYLWQNILQGWSFNCIQFTREIKGNPALECKILKEVAGYGSQLGTLMDIVGVLSKGLEVKDQNEQDAAKLVRFNDLVRKIDRVKKMPANS